jgi:hypothetical protein
MSKQHRDLRSPRPGPRALALLPVLFVVAAAGSPGASALAAQEPPAADAPPAPPPAVECPCPGFPFLEAWPGAEAWLERWQHEEWPGFRWEGDRFERRWTWPEVTPGLDEGLFGFDLPGVEGDTVRARVRVPALERIFLGPTPARFGLRLHDLGDDLGRYFGRTDGALVLEVRDDAPVALRPGDVITAIDGRGVEDAAHAAHILQSYRAGEDLVIEVWREGRAIRIEATAP